MLNKVLIQNNNTTSSINIFEKFYLQQTNKIRKISSSTYSINTTRSKLSSSFQTNATNINIESSNIFIKCFHKKHFKIISLF